MARRSAGVGEGVAKGCAPLLAEIGFKKRAGGVFTVELGSDVLGWLGLNRATRHRPAGEVEVNPVVGVRHQAVERLVAECRGEKFHAYQPPTVSTPLSYLLPEGRYRAWIFGGGEGDVARKMTAAIEAYGVPFMRSTTTLEALCGRLDDGFGFEHQLAFRRPIAWLLAGDARRADEDLDTTLVKLGDRDDLAAQELRRFAAEFYNRGI